MDGDMNDIVMATNAASDKRIIVVLPQELLKHVHISKEILMRERILLSQMMELMKSSVPHFRIKNTPTGSIRT